MSIQIKNYLGIDYGHVRLGLALANSETRLARPLQTLEKLADPLPDLKKIIEAESIGTIVVGLPRGLDGQDTIQTEVARNFAAKLEPLGLTVELQDEAGTTEQAKERFRQATGEKRQADIDSEAASIILQDYLDTNPHHDTN